MAGPKPKTPSPIDRPLSRAYLREFSGWSTAFPPGLSEPTSLRVMENVSINRDGSAQVRPGLRYLSYATAGIWQGAEVVGSFEPFYLPSGDKAYLFAVREDDGTVGFRVLTDGLTWPLDYPGIDFDLPATPDDLHFSIDTTYVRYLQIDNKIVALSDNGESARLFHVGAVKAASVPAALPGPYWSGVLQRPGIFQPDRTFIVGAHDDTVASPGTMTALADTLVSSVPADNVYSMAVFYTYANEFGESEASGISVVRMKRPWSQWQWETPSNVSGHVGEPSGTPETDPRKCADQLVVTVNPPFSPVYADNLAAGALYLNVYAAAWSDQDTAPVDAVLVESRPVAGLAALYGAYVQITPDTPLYTTIAAMPNAANRYNSSAPPTGGQGLVAADRLVLVNDPNNPAVIRWTSNQQGDYLNFSPAKGGGYKTLTSGNLMVPSAVKLWQNPQSVDTLTILCRGTDGYSTGYYMAPASVSSQSEATALMGFEETTATPGTTSPYGVEVYNNALFHPLDEQLMKSTATNYNINHKPQTDTIRDSWEQLTDKVNIVSAQLDGRLYYVVHNPDGAELETHCRGNEIWVLDAYGANEGGGTWSRWLIQAHSLRKLEVGGRVYMGVVRPDGIYYLDPGYTLDDYVPSTVVGTEVMARPFGFALETNTQGANRAHDAWCHLQQLEVTVGDFSGALRYGVRGYDLHGQEVEAAKVLRGGGQADLSDFLLVQREMREWVFFAESIPDPITPELPWPAHGQISLVQYRYAPISVNVGYEYGSVETFEYGKAAAGLASITTNGTPVPMIDTRMP